MKRIKPLVAVLFAVYALAASRLSFTYAQYAGRYAVIWDPDAHLRQIWGLTSAAISGILYVCMQ